MTYRKYCNKNFPKSKIVMNKNILFVAMAAAVTTSCQLSQESKNVKVQTDAIASESIINLERFDILNISRFVVAKDVLVAQNINDEKEYSFLQLQPDSISFKAITVGQGPQEISKFSCLTCYNDTPYIIDMINKNVYKINIDAVNKTAQIEYYAKYPYMLMAMSTKIVDNRRYITSTYSDSCLFMYCDTAGNMISSIPYPQESELSKYPASMQASIWGTSSLEVSPDNKKVVAAFRHEGIAVFCSLENEKLQIVKKDVKEKLCHVKSVNEIGYLDTNPSDVAHVFASAAINDKYVALLYSGQSKDERKKNPKTKEILLYTWNGDLAWRLQPEVDIESLYYSQNMKKLYALTKQPEAVIHVYDIEKYVNE